MRTILVVIVLSLGFLMSSGWVRAQFPHPPAPPTGSVFVEGPVFLGPPPGYRPSAYEHWQYREVTSRGLFRPVVLYSATYGAYYLYNGAPFPSASVRTPVEFKPLAPEYATFGETLRPALAGH